MPKRIGETVRLIIGVLISASAALVTSLMFATRSWRVFVPLAFVAVLVMLAWRYGVAVSVIGSVLTALIFAHFLFTPIGSLQVESDTARINLAWMVLAAVAVSYLLFPSQHINRKN